MDQLPLNELTDWVKRIFYSGLIGSARLTGLSLFFPLFSWLQIRGVLRNVIMVALSVPNIALIYFSLEHAPLPGVFETMPLVLKEMAIGGVLGLLLGLPFWAAQIAGDVTDAFRGASAANLFDPVNSNEMSLTGTFLMLYSLAIFTVLGGMPMLLDALMTSFAVWPSMTLVIDPNMAALASLAGVAGQALFTALIIAAPFLIALALADIALIFAVRSGRSFPIYDLTNTFHNLMFMFILPFFAMRFIEFFPPMLRSLFRSVIDILPSVVK